MGRLFNYNRLPHGSRLRPGIITVGVLLGGVATFVLTDVYSAIFLKDPPESLTRANQRIAHERRIKNRENPVKYHKIGQPVRPDEFLQIHSQLLRTHEATHYPQSTQSH